MNKNIIYLLLVSMLFTACKKENKTASANEQKQDAKTNCKLPRVVESTIALGFPKIEGLAPSVGELNMTVLFVDFEDVQASKSTDSVFSIINPIASEFYEEISYGRLKINLT
ncbi:MAG TPA: hypothetical protein VJ880_00210, partial [Allomuricauda sp.]|nr:hypothetical protein [Allomuricauda sp.]